MLDQLRRLFVRGVAVSSHQAVLDHAIGIQMLNQVEGDYLEFGVFRGDRLTQAYETAAAIAGIVNKRSDPYLQKASAKNLEAMRFIGFDSFEGLPKPSKIDIAKGQEEWIGEGGFSASLEEVSALMPKKAMAQGKIHLVKGWFNESCTPATKERLQLKAAAVVYIDSDYYESAVTALEFVTDLLVDGSILIFDDWFLFRGHPDRGEQRAFREWKERHAIHCSTFIPGTAMSFVVHK